MKQIKTTRKYINVFYCLVLFLFILMLYNNLVRGKNDLFELSSGIKGYSVYKDEHNIYVYDDKTPKKLVWNLKFKDNGYWSSEYGADVLILGKFIDKDSSYTSRLTLLDERVHIRKIGENTYISSFYPTGLNHDTAQYTFVYDGNFNIKQIYVSTYFSYN